ncbi:hypothetical protein L5515_006669 [Caenorhabditis briggsae]|uniref:CYtochrome P450 family n=1 Tax=Caenorhabditis briggsae TaxID=6238 RepID=A0AAE9JJS3_CAEBR|nr:hypothetical protein L5515_006669 [Caenorhabditis briggsae]
MLTVLILISIFSIFIVRTWRASRKLPRGPTPLPLIGNIHQLVYTCWKAGGVVAGLNEFKKQYGKVFTVWIGPVPTVHISDFEIAHETHIKRANMFGARYLPELIDYIREGRGIVASNGDFWQEHRRFALRTLRDFGLGRNIMEAKIMEEYRYRFDDFRKTNFKNGGIEVDAANCFDLLVGSIINTLLISERFEQGDKDFDELKTSLAEGFESASILDAFTPSWLMKSDFWKWRSKTICRPFDLIYAQVDKGIKKRLEDVANGKHIIGEEGDDFVDAFLIKMEKDKMDGVTDSTFNPETMAIDMYDLWIGGQETTSATLTWACACFLQHPEVVQELREELLGVTGGTRGISLTDKPNTPFLNATINEIQRIASILSMNLSRQVKEDTVIDGQPISAGTIVTTQMSMIHTDETVFKNHTEFNPKRFLENNNLDKSLIPFGIGKRVCLGESLARAELYLITGNLVLDFDFQPVGQKPEIKTRSPFAMMKRPPHYGIRFVPLN